MCDKQGHKAFLLACHDPVVLLTDMLSSSWKVLKSTFVRSRPADNCTSLDSRRTLILPSCTDATVHEIVANHELARTTSFEEIQARSEPQWWNSLVLCSTKVIPSFSAVSNTAPSFWLPVGAAI
jgi:hypothetical protein